MQVWGPPALRVSLRPNPFIRLDRAERSHRAPILPSPS